MLSLALMVLTVTPSVSFVSVSPTTAEVGTSVSISWFSSGQASYAVDLYDDFGLFPVMAVASGTSSYTTRVGWVIPASLSPDQYKFKVTVTSSTGATASSLSTSTLTVSSPPSVSFVSISPTTAVAGTSVSINWVSSGQASYRVDLYDEFGGFPVMPVASGTSSFTTQVRWVIPASLPPDRYKFKVTVANSTGSTASSISINTLTVPPPLTNVRVSPSNGSEGDVLTFSWSMPNQRSFTVYLYDSSGFRPVSTAAFLDPSCTWGFGDGSDGCLVKSLSSPSTSATWTVPGALSPATYKIMVEVESTSGGTYTAFSPSFYILPSQLPKLSNVTVSPNGGTAGTHLALQWTSQNQFGYAAYLYDATATSPVVTTGFMTDSCRGLGSTGTDGCLLQAQSFDTSTEWVLPEGLPAGDYTIRMMIWPFSGDPVYAFSPPITMTVATPPPAPEVGGVAVTPQGGPPGTRLTVAWNSVNQERYAVSLYDSAGTNPVSTSTFLSPSCVAAGSTGADGCLDQGASTAARSASWVIPSTLARGTYTARVVVQSADERSASAVSPGFEVVAGNGSLCGNGIKDKKEVCDGADIGGATCSSLGYEYGGTLACAASCGSFDESRCCATLDPARSPPPPMGSRFDTGWFAPDSPVRLQFDYTVPPVTPAGRCELQSAAGTNAELCLHLGGTSFECTGLGLTAASTCAAPSICSSPPAAECDWGRPCCATTVQFDGEARRTWTIDPDLRLSGLNPGTRLSGSLEYLVRPRMDGALLRGACGGAPGPATADISIQGSSSASMDFTLFGQPVTAPEVGLSLCAGMTGPVEDMVCEDDVACSLASGVRVDVSLPSRIDIQWFHIEPRTFLAAAEGQPRACP